MLLDKKRKAELAKRKGSTGKTLIQTLWFFISIGVAFGLVWWLNSSGTFPLRTLYSAGIPRAVPEWAVMVGFIIVIAIVMQIFLLLGFLIGSPKGRARQGRATLESKTVDFTGGDYDD